MSPADGVHECFDLFGGFYSEGFFDAAADIDGPGRDAPHDIGDVSRCETTSCNDGWKAGEGALLDCLMHSVPIIFHS